MLVVKSEQIVCVDVDQTLIIWSKLKKSHKIATITCPYTGKQEYLRIHEPHVKILKDRLARGATVIVWSANGYKWAQAVLKALNISHDRVHVYSKPVMYIDDKVATDWMGEHVYIDPDSEYK